MKIVCPSTQRLDAQMKSMKNYVYGRSCIDQSTYTCTYSIHPQLFMYACSLSYSAVPLQDLRDQEFSLPSYLPKGCRNESKS